MKLIALDDGHGMLTPGKRTPFIASIGRYIPENEFNRAVVKYLNEELKRCGFKTLLTAPTDDDTPLEVRVKKADDAKADLFISIHFNALDGKFDGEGKDPEGFSAHVQSKLYESAKFAKIALKHLANGTVQVNRGLVEQNLYVTRETDMPACLFELGFMDNNREALLMINPSFQKECAVEIAQAVCEYYNKPYKGSEKPVVEKPPVPAVEKPKSLVKLGTLVTKQDVPAYARKEWGTQTGQVVAKGEARNVYAVEDGWYQLYSGEWLPSQSGVNFEFTPIKKPELVKEPPKSLKRLFIDGERIGAFGDREIILKNVADALDKAKDIRIEDVKQD